MSVTYLLVATVREVASMQSLDGGPIAVCVYQRKPHGDNDW